MYNVKVKKRANYKLIFDIKTLQNHKKNLINHK